jgi:hypothetical protein
MNDVEFALEIGALAGRVERLGQSRRTPEHFHAEKSDIVACLRRLAGRRVEAARRQPTTTWRPPYVV